MPDEIVSPNLQATIRKKTSAAMLAEIPTDHGVVGFLQQLPRYHWVTKPVRSEERYFVEKM